MSGPNTALYNTQEIVHEGILFYFNRDSVPVANGSGGIVTHTYGWQGLGTIEARSDKVNLDSETIYDDSSGRSRPITVINNGYEQVYEFTTPNVAMPLREIYLQSLPPIAPTELPGGTITSAPINLYPGQPAKIMNANGSSGALAVTSITSITVASTPLVFGVDYGATPQMLAAGFIQILPTSTVVPSTTPGPVAATITYVATAVTSNVRLKPGTGPCCVQGQGEMHIITCGQLQYVDQGYFSITIPEAVRDPKKATRLKPTVTRLFDPTGTYADDVTWYK
jgi:hypothetical protein